MIAFKLTRPNVFLMIVMLLSLSLINPAQANPRYASIVIDANSGIVLHESNADAVRYPASLTKMMTLYMLFEALEQRKMTMDTRMPVSAHAASMPSTNIHLRTGDTISVREAIPALIVRSANDVASVVAEALGQTEANFGRMMTEKARAIGMRSTTFRNASGLPNNEQKTTARDMVTLSARLMRDFPQYYHFFSTQSFTYKGTTYNSHNRMVRNTQGVDGMKTGFIRASGFNVATSAKRGNHRVFAVVMGGQTAASRDQHMARLLDQSFNPGTQVASNHRPTQSAPVTVQVVRAAPPPKPQPLPALRSVAAVETTTVTPAVTPTTVATQPVARSVVPTKPQPVAIANDNGNNNWAIQLGTYVVHERAQAHAQDATRWLPGEAVVTPVEIRNRLLFRAQLIGLEEKQARTACQSLVRQGMECLVFKWS